MADYKPEMGADEAAGTADLTGKVVIVTGASAGLGVETVRVLAAHGAKMVGVVRDLDKARRALEDVPQEVDLVVADLFDLQSARQGAAELAGRYPVVDMLINNAGVMAAPLARSAEGLDMHLGTNFLGHFVLTAGLMDSLLASNGARVINLTSSAHRLSPVREHDPFFEKEEYNKLAAYGQSKTANVLFTLELDRRYRERGLRATAVHPGLIDTELGRFFTEDEMVFLKDGIPEGISMKSVSQGAATTVWAACVEDFDAIAARFCEDCAVADEISDPDEDGRGVVPHALDMEVAGRLWNLASEWSNTNFP